MARSCVGEVAFINIHINYLQIYIPAEVDFSVYVGCSLMEEILYFSIKWLEDPDLIFTETTPWINQITTVHDDMHITSHEGNHILHLKKNILCSYSQFHVFHLSWY